MHAMRKQFGTVRTTYVLTAAFLLTGALTGLKKGPADEVQSPGSVVSQFIKLELQGIRLEPEGWHKTSQFFVRSEPPRSGLDILIVSGTYQVRERKISPTHAQVDLNFDHFFGRLDPALHFHPEPDSLPGFGIIKQGLSSSYKLVFSDRYSEEEQNSQRDKVVATAPCWRMETFEAGVLLDLPAAIRYVTEVKGRTSDRAIKRNAGETLAILRMLK